MSDKKKILFLLNPISGIGKKNIIPPLIDKHFKESEFEVELRNTEYRNHGNEIAISEKENFDAIVAIGGDGSVNEIGSALVGSNCALGFIPAGSGNGLARHLRVPLDIEEAIIRIKDFKISTIDTGTVNNIAFLGTCGFGYDGYIAKKFDEYHKRGFRSYIKLVIKEYRKYESLTFTAKSEKLEWTKTLAMCTVANSCQFGNGFQISPKSVTDDAQFELIQIDRFKMILAPLVIKRFFNGTIDRSKYFSFDPITSDLTIKVEDADQIPFHVDGEPLTGGPVFEIKLLPASLKVI